ncbi:MAG: biotin/lipoyl-binding protein, partial [Pseudomonadota bacterium]
MTQKLATRSLRSRFIAVARGVGTVTLTLAVLGLAAVLVMGGRDVIAERAAARATDGAVAPAPALTVRVATLTYAESYEVERRFSGQVEPAQESVLGFELAGTVATLLVDEGDRVEKGAPLARLDTRLLEAERTQLAANRTAIEAQAELARRTTERQTTL